MIPVLVVISAIALPAAGTVSTYPHGNGDPGGMILRALAAIRGAAPAGSISFGQETEEPSWIASCSDEYFKLGWGMVDYGIEFDSELPYNEVLTDVTARMSELGWGSRHDVAGGSWGWSKRLPHDVTAHAGLNHPFRGQEFWFLSAHSPPHQPVGRCAGG